MRSGMRWDPAVLLACVGLAVCLGAPDARAQATAGEQPEQPPVAEPPPVDDPPAVEPLGDPDGEVEDLVDMLGEQPELEAAAGQDSFTLSAFSEPVELRALVEYVAEALNVTIVASEGLTGSITINSPVTVERGELLDLLSFMLEQNNFALVSDRPGFYRIVPADAVAPAFGGPLATTRIIPTGPVRPSALADVLQSQLGLASAVQGGAGRPGAGRVAFMDDLGVIVVTDTPSRVRLAEELVARILERWTDQALIRFDLDYVAATVARERVIDLVGRGGAQLPGFNVPPEQRQGLPGQALANLSERLSVDPRGNAIIFRGTPAEAAGIEEALDVIDVPVLLEPRRYFAGSYAAQIAQIAKDQGLGDIQVLEQQQLTPGGQQNNFNAQRLQQMQEGIPGFGLTTEALRGGPTMVVDPARGTIVYYGTEPQQAQLAALIEQFDIDLEEIVIQEYKLHNADAETVAELLNGLVQNQLPSGESPLLPGGGAGTQQFFQRFQQQMQNQQNNQRGRFRGGPAAEGEGAEGGAIGFDAEEVFVIPDPANNQVIVKAPGRVQQQFARLIERIDLRRPQVFVDVQIVSVTASDDFRLAFETQLVNAGGAGGVIGTNFGLTTPGDDITERRTVGGGLQGLTAALIDSDQVPIVINALQRVSNTRILSSPQLLVDDNEEAAIVSIEEQPFATTSQTVGNPQVTSFDYVEAGTKLTVTPSISEGGYIRLAYEIELSSFTGNRPSADAPPPRQQRSLTSEAVTIPGDSTIVVGGIRVNTDSDTVIKVPLLGDIPLLGHLFRDTNKNDSRTTLYVFITPRILRDPNFRDLMLLTRGPQAEVGVEPWVPELRPSLAEIVAPSFPTVPPPPPHRPGPAPTEDPGPGELPAELLREERD